MNEFKSVFKEALAKVGTVIVDRRFWVAVFGVFGIPELVDDAVGISESLVVIVQSIVPLFLLVSWTIREPSGLKSNLIKTLNKLGIED